MRYRAIAILVAAGCRGDAKAPPSPTVDDGPLEHAVTVGDMSYVFRASPMANLTYALDCLAGLEPCTTAVFEAVWKRSSWSTEDTAALDVWRDVRTSYRATIQDRAKPAQDPPLPIAYGRPIDLALRYAGFGARDVTDYESRLALIASDADVTRIDGALAQFRSRADAAWRADRPALATAAVDLAAIAKRTDVAELAMAIAKFYAASTQGTQERFELIARPSDGDSLAENLDRVVAVEVPRDKPAQQQFSTIQHEVIHAWFKHAPIERRFDLAVSFARSGDPLAGPAYGLLDEALATAFGEMFTGLLDPAELTRLTTQPLGFYDDPWIDPLAKRLLPVLRESLAHHETLFDADFLALYLRTVHATFPDGLPPSVYLRPLACVTQDDLQAATDHLAVTVAAPIVDCSSKPTEAQDILVTHRAWGTAILVTTAGIPALESIVDAETFAQIQAQPVPSVSTTLRHPIGATFVFVATDEPQLLTLIDAFAKQTTPARDGIFTP